MVSLGVAFGLAMSGQALRVPSAEAAISTSPPASHQPTFAADEGNGSEDSGSQEEESGDDSD